MLSLLTGQPLAGEPLELQSLGPSGPPASTFATTTTGADGSWSQSISFQENTLVRALHRGQPASVADLVVVAVAPVITLNVQSTSPLVVSGNASPAKSHLTLDVYRAGATGRRPIARKRVKTVHGSFTKRLALPRPGNYVIIARSAAGTRNAAGASAPVAVTTT